MAERVSFVTNRISLERTFRWVGVRGRWELPLPHSEPTAKLPTAKCLPRLRAHVEASREQRWELWAHRIRQTARAGAGCQ